MLYTYKKKKKIVVYFNIFTMNQLKLTNQLLKLCAYIIKMTKIEELRLKLEEVSNFLFWVHKGLVL